MGEWVKELETVIITQEKATDLTTATRLYQKHKVGVVYVSVLLTNLLKLRLVLFCTIFLSDCVSLTFVNEPITCKGSDSCRTWSNQPFKFIQKHYNAS